MQKIFLTSAFIVFSCLLLPLLSQAQDGNGHEGLRSQIMNGTKPGWLFSRTVQPPAPAATGSPAEEGKESLIARIRKATAPGMRFALSPAGSAASPAAGSAGPADKSAAAPAGKAAARSGPLPSEQPAKPAAKGPATTPAVHS